MVRVAEDLNEGKELRGLEMGVLYTKIPDSIKSSTLLLCGREDRWIEGLDALKKLI